MYHGSVPELFRSQEERHENVQNVLGVYTNNVMQEDGGLRCCYGAWVIHTYKHVMCCKLRTCFGRRLQWSVLKLYGEVLKRRLERRGIAYERRLLRYWLRNKDATCAGSRKNGKVYGQEYMYIIHYFTTHLLSKV